MNWSRLKNNCCPKCNALLNCSFLDALYHCTGLDCDFSIAEDKFDKIINDMYAPRKRTVDDFDDEKRLSELNNMGHEIPSKDYSDRL